MPTPLLTTKLYIPPPRPALVPRPRLVERLNAGLDTACRLMLVSAPAGFGKTTLLSEWIYSVETAEQTIPTLFAWLSLDKGDNDPTRFWAYVVAALREVRLDIGAAALTILQSPQPATASAPHDQVEWIETILTDLINELAEAGPAPLVLVLDDLHLIENSQIHDELVFLMEHLPPHIHLVVSSRADPPWPLARWRARCQVTELRSEDLRFTSVEAAAFLSLLKLDLSPADVAALEERTEGWIAGLQMAAISMQARKQAQETADLTGFVQAFTGSHRFVLDYLIEEVLNQQPPDVHKFLLQTSILERMSAPLCDAVTDRTDSQAMLTRLDRANLFLVPLDDKRRWYRYHHLFSDLLKSRLMRTLPDSGVLLHQRASTWYAAEHDLENAIAHALAAQDFERAASLVEQAVQNLDMQNQQAMLTAWVDSLPREILETRPWLCVYRAWGYYWTGRREMEEEWLQAAEKSIERTFEEGSPEWRHIQGHIAAVRAHTACSLLKTFPARWKWGKRPLNLLPDGDEMRLEDGGRSGWCILGTRRCHPIRASFWDGPSGSPEGQLHINGGRPHRLCWNSAGKTRSSAGCNGYISRCIAPGHPAKWQRDPHSRFPQREIGRRVARA